MTVYGEYECDTASGSRSPSVFPSSESVQSCVMRMAVVVCWDVQTFNRFDQIAVALRLRICLVSRLARLAGILEALTGTDIFAGSVERLARAALEQAVVVAARIRHSAGGVLPRAGNGLASADFVISAPF
ncbi:hypothetical protein Efla_005142 [Eimeria flavescens]